MYNYNWCEKLDRNSDEEGVLTNCSCRSLVSTVLAYYSWSDIKNENISSATSFQQISGKHSEIK